MTSLAGRTAGLSGLLLLLLASTTSAQSLARQIADAPDGKVRMSFAAREGVCGNGRSMHMIAADRGRPMWIGRSDDWEATCDPGPVRVVLRVRGGEVRDIDTYVGGRWRTGGEGVTDLGTVPALEAAQYLIGLAERRGGGVGEDAILPAMLAEGALVWPDLLRIARDGAVARETRKSAVFWLGQAAAEAATEGLDSLVEDDDVDRSVRAQAIFALSQRPQGEGVPALIRVARTNPDPHLRKKALFWLGQSEDPRALALFEDILIKN